MSTTELLSTLLRRNIELRVESGNLRYRAPKGALTPSLRDALKANKEAIVAQLPAGKRVLLCSYAQERLWYLHGLYPETAVYNVPVAWHFSGMLNIEALQQSLQAVIERHETLRTTFEIVGGWPVQMIGEATEFAFMPVTGVTAEVAHCLLEASTETQAMAWLQEAARLPFDLQTGPLFRSMLIRVGAESHYLLLNMHHIVTDGWSMPILYKELASLYEAFLAGMASPLQSLPIQYAGYTQWQRGQFEGDGLEEQLAFWREELGSGFEPLALPTDYPRPLETTYEGAELVQVLSPELSVAVRRLGQEAGCTLFMTLLAAYEVLLHRYSDNRADILVGAPVANRRAETEGLIGFFVNTLVIRGRLSGTLTFRQFLEQIRETVLGAYTHQDVPFERLVEVLQPERNLNYHPIFQVFFTIEEQARSRVAWPGLDSDEVSLVHETTKFDLSLRIVSSGDGLTAVFTYNTHLFAPERIERMMGHLQTLLKAVTDDPDQPLAYLPLLTLGEREEVLYGWNNTHYDYGPEQTLAQLFSAQVVRSPKATAVVWGNESVSYEVLEAQANQLASYLRQLGVGADVLVGLFMDRSVEMVVALLAVLKAGGAYVPLDPMYPEERLAYMLADAGINILLTQERWRSYLQPQVKTLVCVDSEWAQISQAERQPLVSVSNPNNLAYVIYTSGSTGKPKGVMVCHRNAVALVRWAREAFSDEETAVVLAATSVCFDLSIFELFVPLSRGGCVVLAENALQLAEMDEAVGITLINTVPSAITELLRMKGVPATVQTVNLAGELLQQHLVERIYKETGAGRVNDLYGPSEDTTYSTYVQRMVGGQTTIGKPIANTQLYLLDRYLQPVPVGMVGEIYLGGAGITRGYWQRPGLTAERFIPNPFALERGGGERLYWTGDLGRYLPNGDVEFLGRRDHQVKVRGFRIELGDIEATLAQHSSVREVVVTAWETAHEPQDKQLVAYIVPEGDVPGTHELKQFARTRLPDYMVPTFFVPLMTLPLNTSGKVDRKALPAPTNERTGSPVVEPQTELEEAIAAIWQAVLKVEQVGIDDNFFDLGGHSLLLVQVHSQLQAYLGQKLPQITLLRYPTVRALAEHLNPQKETATVPVELASPTVEVRAQEMERVEVAIVGMSGRWPGAANVAEFWQNLHDGVEAITFFSDEELLASGISPELVENAAYVKARGFLADYDKFDGPFFGYTPREAQILDPQQRLFLECAWACLEDAGYAPGTHEGRVGIWGGSSMSGYLLTYVWPNRPLVDMVGAYQALMSNDPNVLTTRVSYKLNLNGPSVNVQTACSTSAVAVHLACQSLLSGECDLALAGGVSVYVPQLAGYMYNEGSIDSPDGHCRPFDAAAQGTVQGSGVGMVALKRLPDAVADGDTILAVIKGSAVNNDGAQKVGFTAPSVDGQADVIQAAQEAAGVEASSIGYVEAHGTATALGDPVEVAALAHVFAQDHHEKEFCRIGSVKSNVGHLDTAAGVTGLIKTVLALQHRVIPPSLHFEQPNPEIDFANTPFVVNDVLTPWPNGKGPRRAGVSSFGIGGTNVHIVLEEAPPLAETSLGKPAEVITLSAKTMTALDGITADLLAYLETHETINLADVAYTLQLGRKAFNHRRVVVGRDVAEVCESLRSLNPKQLFTAVAPHCQGA